MVKRKLRIVSGLAGLLVAAGVNGLLNDHGSSGWVGSAYAQDADSEDADADTAQWDELGDENTEEAGEDASLDDVALAQDDAGIEEESEPADDMETSDDAASSVQEEAAEPADESVAEGPAPSDTVPETQVEETPTPGPQQTPQSPVVSKSDRARQTLIDAIREIVPGLDAHVFADRDRLVDLGANSVDRAEIAMLAQERLGLSVARVELFGPKNLGELIALFASKMP